MEKSSQKFFGKTSMENSSSFGKKKTSMENSSLKFIWKNLYGKQ